MAIRACGFVYFESEQDFDSMVIVCGNGMLRYCGDKIERPAQYPICFEHIPSFDDHLCGEWRPHKDPYSMLQAIAEKEQYYHDIWEKIEEYDYHKKFSELY